MKKFIKEYRVELLALLVTLLGIFLLVEQFEIRRVVWSWLRGAAPALQQLWADIKNWMVNYITTFTLSDLTGWTLIIATTLFIAWRIRYRFLHSQRWHATACPKCGSHLRRIHRTRLDRILTATLLPRAHRYKCANDECQWSGLRHHQRQKAPTDGEETGEQPA